MVGYSIAVLILTIVIFIVLFVLLIVFTQLGVENQFFNTNNNKIAIIHSPSFGTDFTDTELVAAMIRDNLVPLKAGSYLIDNSPCSSQGLSYSVSQACKDGCKLVIGIFNANECNKLYSLMVEYPDVLFVSCGNTVNVGNCLTNFFRFNVNDIYWITEFQRILDKQFGCDKYYYFVYDPSDLWSNYWAQNLSLEKTKKIAITQSEIENGIFPCEINKNPDRILLIWIQYYQKLLITASNLPNTSLFGWNIAYQNVPQEVNECKLFYTFGSNARPDLTIPVAKLVGPNNPVVLNYLYYANQVFATLLDNFNSQSTYTDIVQYMWKYSPLIFDNEGFLEFRECCIFSFRAGEYKTTLIGEYFSSKLILGKDKC